MLVGKQGRMDNSNGEEKKRVTEHETGRGVMSECPLVFSKKKQKQKDNC